MPILIDGNNLLHRLPEPDRGRGNVRQQVLDACRRQRRRVTVVFDGAPPPGSPARESLGPVTVLYAGPAPADDVIVGRIPGGARGREWVVVTDDRRLARRARERGAAIRSLDEWRRGAAAVEDPDQGKPGEDLSPDEVAHWEAYFSSRSPADDD